MSELLALGASFHTAPIGVRERIALTDGRAEGVLRELAERRDRERDAASAPSPRAGEPVA